jgi:hypothetical protein
MVLDETATMDAFTILLLGQALVSSEIPASPVRPSRIADEWNRAAEERFRYEMAEIVDRLCRRRLIKAMSKNSALDPYTNAEAWFRLQEINIDAHRLDGELPP